MLRTNLTAQAIDEVLAETFPASDPPAWTSGIARLMTEIAVTNGDGRTDRDERTACERRT
jgi:hypothetical protein